MLSPSLEELLAYGVPEKLVCTGVGFASLLLHMVFSVLITRLSNPKLAKKKKKKNQTSSAIQKLKRLTLQSPTRY